MNDDLLKVHALADCQLDEAESNEVQRHIDSCERCRAEFLAVVSLKNLVAAKCQNPDAKESWAKCQKRLNEIDRTSRIESFVGRYSWAMCAILFLVIVGASLTNRVFGRNSIHTGEVANMVSSMAPMSSLRPTSWFDSQKWLQRTFGYAPAQKQPEGLAVLGMAHGSVNGRRGALLKLADAKGVMNLLVIDAEGLEGGTKMEGRSKYSVGQINMVNSIAWTDRDVTFVLIGNRPFGALGDVADKISLQKP